MPVYRWMDLLNNKDKQKREERRSLSSWNTTQREKKEIYLFVFVSVESLLDSSILHIAMATHTQHSNFSHLLSLVSVPLRSLLPSRRHGPTFLWKEMSLLLDLITESNIYFVFLPPRRIKSIYALR